MFKPLDRASPGTNQVMLPPPSPLDSTLALTYHSTVRRRFFYERGIADYWINKSLLGFAKKWLVHPDRRGEWLWRYSIPVFMDKKLWAVQYRITPERETRLKAEGKSFSRYISQPGGTKGLLNANLMDDNPDLPYILVDESPLDALALCSLGFPTMAVVQLNSKAKAWETGWNKYLRGKTVVLIAQYDEHENGLFPSRDFALLRCQDIPNSSVKIVPLLKRYEKRDSGDIVKQMTKEQISRWLGLPTIEEIR